MCAKRIPLEDRFWMKVDQSGDCWNWTGAIGSTGYGHITEGGAKGKTLTASRVSYEIHYGKIEGQLFVLHKCDNPKCVRPDHLFLGTNKDNAHDMIGKGRSKLSRGIGSGEKSPTSKLNWSEVCQIRDLSKSGKSQRWIASHYGVGAMSINKIVRNIHWKTQGEKFPVLSKGSEPCQPPTSTR